MTKVAQTPFELEQMVNVCRNLKPRKILEIGVWYGGTLAHWLKIAGVVVAVDDQMLEAETWKGWADEHFGSVKLLHGKSQDPRIVDEVAKGAPYDFCLIDGDHSYDGVNADWLNYGPMCKVVAFHDILPRPDSEVSRLWQEIKPGRFTIEIVGTEPGPDYDNPVAGVGIVWM